MRAKIWSRTPTRFAVAALAAVLGAGVAAAIGDSASSARGTQVRFLSPFATQSNPFTPPVDVAGHTTIRFIGPFGGTGSNTVCDRELLIRDLAAHPDRMRAWAQVEGIATTPSAVARFIRSLEPATLIRDTSVTDWSYANGEAYAFQAILEAGTAVLVDSQGNIRARCRCGNPLTYPVLYPVETCVGCRAGYTLPETGTAYLRYPDPPPVRGAVSRRTKAPKTILVNDPGGPQRPNTILVPRTVTGPGGVLRIETVPVTVTQHGTSTVVVTRTVTSPGGVVKTVTVPVTVTERQTTPGQTVYSTVTQTVYSTLTQTVPTVVTTSSGGFQ